MKKLLYLSLAVVMLLSAGCTKSDFAESYADPSTIANSTVEKQYTGFMGTNRWYVLPEYYNYFVVLRTTLTHYTQAVGYVNALSQYVPGEAGTSARWGTYYNFLSQYRNFEKLYNELSEEDKAAKRVYMLTAMIYLYDHTQKVIDLHGDIPFFNAGMISVNGGDYAASSAPYDNAEDIYTKMLDDLKAISEELNSITVTPAIQTGFKTQDIVNKGDVEKWKKYCNSLRLRMLTQVAEAPSFSSRYASEFGEIISNQSTNPIVTSNDDNIYIKVYNLDTEIHSKNFRTGLEDWNGNLAGKQMMDFMNGNSDPRLPVMFEPGENAGGAYVGLDPLLPEADQTTLVADGEIAIYNRSTLSRNQFFPGMLINASQVQFMIAEYQLRTGNDGAAKTAYNDAVMKSIDYYYWLRTLSNDATVAAPPTPSDAQKAAYLTQAGVNWDAANGEDAKLGLIATQSWIHFSVVQMPESWATQRRLDSPVLEFQPDNSNAQTQPPVRWLYPSNERVYNTANYEAVRAEDNLTTKIFWDIN